MGTRCLSISVVRRSGGAAGKVVRRAGTSGVAVGVGEGGGVVSSVIERSSPPAYSGPEMPPSFRIRQKWTARKNAAVRGRKTTCRT